MNSQTTHSGSVPHAENGGRHALRRLAGALLAAFLVGVGAFIAWGIWRAAFPPKPPLQGQMEARSISVASKVPGRVARILVREGDFVRAGQVVAELSLPELEARLEGAQAQAKGAEARQSLVDAGARGQEKEAARAEWERAAAEAALARKTYERIAALYRDGLVSAQRYDEARAAMVAAGQLAEAVRDRYAIAETGARPQEKEAAADASAEAKAGVAEVAALTTAHVLTAPVDAQVDTVVLVQGEVAGAGFPVVTLVNLNDQWAAFNIREDEMPGIAIGGRLEGEVPAIGGRAVEYEIYYISPRASYATWRSTRQNSGYDMKTFEVRARPTQTVEGLRPGMSVLVSRRPEAR